MASIRIQSDCIRRKECPAAHAGIHIPVLQLLHDLGADIIWNHSLCCTPCRQLSQIPIRCILGDIVLVQNIDQLGKRGGNPHADLILDPLVPLLQRFGDDQGKVVPYLSGLHFIQIHEYRNERRLSVGGKERLDLILDGLNAALHFLAYTHLCHTVHFIFGVVPADGEELILNLTFILLTGDIYKGCEMG